MQARTPDILGFGKCPSQCENFGACMDAAASITALELAVDADLSAPVECDPASSFAVYDEQILLNAAARAFPGMERGCPVYVPPYIEQF